MTEGPKLDPDLMFEDVFKEMPQHSAASSAQPDAHRSEDGASRAAMASMNMIQALNSAMDIMLGARSRRWC